MGTPCFASGTGLQLDGPLAYNPTAASSSNNIITNVITQNVIGINILQDALNNVLNKNKVYVNFSADVIDGNNTN